MQIFNNNKKISDIYHRTISLSIGKSFAEKKSGKIEFSKHQDSEQENSRRELLSVELDAKKEKIITEHGQNHFRKQVMDAFFLDVRNQVNSEFENQESLYYQVLNIEDAAPAMLELLSLRAASVNKIKSLTKSLSWLKSDLISLVNKPQYRKKADVQVTNAELAISYIGLDNLKLVIPTFILKHWLPISTAPFSLMKKKLWNDSLSVALASSALAKLKNLDTFTAFTTGMLSNIGQLAVTRILLTTYNDMHAKKLRNAYESKDKKLHDILAETDSSPELLFEQIKMRSSKLSADLVELMHFDRLRITEPMFDLAYAENVDEMCPIAQIVIKAKAYVAFRTLAKENLINGEEAKFLLKSVNLTQSEITLLKKSDIDHIKLNFQ